MDLITTTHPLHSLNILIHLLGKWNVLLTYSFMSRGINFTMSKKKHQKNIGDNIFNSAFVWMSSYIVRNLYPHIRIPLRDNNNHTLRSSPNYITFIILEIDINFHTKKLR